MRPDDRERMWWNEAWQVFESESLGLARDLDVELEGSLRAIQLRLCLEPRRVHTAGTFLVQFEREARRAVSLPIGERDFGAFLNRFEARPRPESPRWAGFEIADTRPGSLEWLLEPYGTLESLFTSQLFQMVAATSWLLGHGAKVVAIIRRHRKDPDPDIRELAVVSMPDGARISVPRGGRLMVTGEGRDRVIELDVGFGER